MWLVIDGCCWAMLPNTLKTEFDDDDEGDAATAATTVPGLTADVVITDVKGAITGTAATDRAEKRVTGLTLKAVATGNPVVEDTDVGLGELQLETPFVIVLILLC